MSKKRHDSGLRAEINVTPLVDVMLVLLIIFMVITPMLQKGKAVQLPTVDQPEKQPDADKDVVVSLEYTSQAPGYRVYLGRTLVEERALVARLEDELRRHPRHELYLKGDARLSYGTVRRVMGVCHDAGFPQVKLATEQLKRTTP